MFPGADEKEGNSVLIDSEKVKQILELAKKESLSGSYTRDDYCYNVGVKTMFASADAAILMLESGNENMICKIERRLKL